MRQPRRLAVVTSHGRALGMLALAAAWYLALVLAAVLRAPLLFAILLVPTTALDYLIERSFPGLAGLLRRAQLAISHRAYIQIFLLLVLVAGTNEGRGTSRRELVVVTVLALAVPLVRAGYTALLAVVRRRLVGPVEVRNLSVPALAERVEIPRLLGHRVEQRLVPLGAVPVLVGVLGIWDGEVWPFLVAVGGYAAVLGAGATLLVRLLVRSSPRPDPQRQLAEASRALAAYGPEVLLYFSGSRRSTYQVNMWLETLAQTRRRCAVVLRERYTMRGLARTRLPVVCLESPVHLMNFPFPQARVALYVANVGANIHFLRERRIKHVFIGHGDSDKVASFNPFSKVYDEVWVAGRAGRERYERALVGVREHAIVEVGRPQLDGLRRAPAGPVREPVTVFYAPTWEGWTDEDFQTSLTEMGPDLVESLLTGPLRVRVVYKPHPLTGSRDRRAAVADLEIRRLLARAGQAEQGPGPGGGGRHPGLVELEARLDAPGLDVADERRLQAEWSELFWSLSSGRHLVVSGRRPGLFDCFAAADVLVSDVSSLVTDFVATDKPYVVANPRNEPEEVFRERYPSTRAAYLLGPEAGDIRQLMATIVRADPLAPERERLREYLLGPDEPPAIDRWNDALERVIRGAEREWRGEHGAGPTARVRLPTQPVAGLAAPGVAPPA